MNLTEVLMADEEIRISWQDIEDAFQSCFVNPALIITIFAKAKADTAERLRNLKVVMKVQPKTTATIWGI